MPRINLKHGDSLITLFGTRYDIQEVREYCSENVEIEDTDGSVYWIDYEQITAINNVNVKDEVEEDGEVSNSIFYQLYPEKQESTHSYDYDHRGNVVITRNQYGEEIEYSPDGRNCRVVGYDDDIYKPSTIDLPVTKDVVEQNFLGLPTKQQEINKENTNLKKENVMNTAKTQNTMMASLFGKIKVGEIKNDRFRMGMEGIAVQNNDGEYASFDMENKTLTTEMDGMTFDFGKFFYLPVKTVKVGDLVVVDSVIGYVTDTKNKQIVINDILTNTIVTKMPKKNRFGLSFHTKVVSMMDMFDDNDNGVDPMMMMAMMNSESNPQMLETLMLMDMMGAENEKNDFLPLMMMSGMGNQPTQIVNGKEVPQNPMAQMLPMMMMMGDDNNDMKKMLPFMMMSGQGGMDMNSMMPMMMLMGDDNKDMKKMLPFMMMSGQGQEINPMMMMMMMLGKGDKNSSMSKMLPMMMMSGQNGGGTDMMAQMMMMKFIGGLEKETKELKESEMTISGNDADEYKRFLALKESGEIDLTKKPTIELEKKPTIELEKKPTIELEEKKEE